MGNMADQNRFWSAKWSNWSENGQWPTVISSTVDQSPFKCFTTYMTRPLLKLMRCWTKLEGEREREWEISELKPGDWKLGTHVILKNYELSFLME